MLGVIIYVCKAFFFSSIEIIYFSIPQKVFKWLKVRFSIFTVHVFCKFRMMHQNNVLFVIGRHILFCISSSPCINPQFLFIFTSAIFFSQISKVLSFSWFYFCILLGSLDMNRKKEKKKIFLGKSAWFAEDVSETAKRLWGNFIRTIRWLQTFHWTCCCMSSSASLDASWMLVVWWNRLQLGCFFDCYYFFWSCIVFELAKIFEKANTVNSKKYTHDFQLM